jgi:peptide methionine sulfoxide reductase MsrB
MLELNAKVPRMTQVPLFEEPVIKSYQQDDRVSYGRNIFQCRSCSLSPGFMFCGSPVPLLARFCISLSDSFKSRCCTG